MKGFSLIELMVVMAIIGIIAAVGLPAYRESQMRSARAEAKTALLEVAACSGGAITNCFLATATPQGGQADDTCGNLTLTSTGVRAASGGTQDECWVR